MTWENKMKMLKVFLSCLVWKKMIKQNYFFYVCDWLKGKNNGKISEIIVIQLFYFHGWQNSNFYQYYIAKVYIFLSHIAILFHRF